MRRSLLTEVEALIEMETKTAHNASTRDLIASLVTFVATVVKLALLVMLLRANVEKLWKVVFIDVFTI